MSELAKAVVRLEADISDLQAGFALAEEEMKKAGKSLESLGQELSLKVTLPLAAIGALAVKEFGEEQDAIAKVNAVLAATGGISNTTTSHLEEMAHQMQELTRFSDDEVLSAEGLLLTFQNVRNELGAGNAIFDRTIHDVADLASVMGTDLSTATLQLGRALQDPESGLMLLRRAGVQFTAGEREMIKVMLEHNQVLEAQRVILEKVEGKTKDAAKAMADTPMGHFVQMWNAIKDAVKPVGDVLDQVLVPLADLVKQAADAFRQLSPEIIRIIVLIGATAAALGPVLVAWATIAKLWTFVETVIGVGLLPTLGLLVLALGSLIAAGMAIVDNWAWIKLQAVSLWTALKDAFFTGIEFILTKVQELGQLAQKIPALARALVPGLGTIADLMTILGDAAGTMKDKVTKAHEEMLADAGRQLSELQAEYDAVVEKVAQSQKKIVTPADTSREEGWTTAAIKGLNDLRTALTSAAQMQQILGDSFDLVGAKASAYQAIISALQGAQVPLNQTISAAALHLKGELVPGFNDMLEVIKRLDPSLNVANLTLAQFIQRFQQLQAQAVMDTLRKSLQDIANKAALLGDAYNAAADEATAYQTAVNALIALHIPLAQVFALTGQRFSDLVEAMNRATRDAVLADLTNQFAVLKAGLGGTSDQISAVSGAINKLAADLVAAGGSSKVLEAAIADLKKELRELQLKAAIGDFFQQEIGKMIDAIFEGKQKFGDFIRDMLYQLSLLILKMEVLQLIGSIGGGSVGKFLGIPGFAMGGFLPAGQLGIVGEQGPELVRAGRSGMTISRLDEARGTAPAPSAAQGSRMTVPVTVNVNTIDSQGVADFFSKNQDVVAATFVKAAQRSKLLRGS